MSLCSVLESNCVWPSNIKLLWPAVFKSEANQGKREKGERTGNGVRCFRKLSGVDWLIPDGKGQPSWPRKYSLGKEVGLWKGKAWEWAEAGMHFPLPLVFKHSETLTSPKRIISVLSSFIRKQWRKLNLELWMYQMYLHLHNVLHSSRSGVHECKSPCLCVAPYTRTTTKLAWFHVVDFVN